MEVDRADLWSQDRHYGHAKAYAAVKAMKQSL